MKKILLLLSFMLILTGCFDKKDRTNNETDSDNLEITNLTQGTVNSSGNILGATGDVALGSPIIIESSILVPIEKVVTINFSEIIAAQTVNSSSIYIVDIAGNPILATLNVVENQITIIPNEFFLPDSRYTIVVTMDVKDIKGRSLQGLFNYTFPTAPDVLTPPILLSVTPANGTVVSPSTEIVMTFNEDIAGNVRIVVVDNTTNSSLVGSTVIVANILRFVPANPLNHATNYRAALEGNVEDVDGNIYDGLRTWSFTTESAVVITPPTDTTSPSLVGLTPTDSAINIDKTTAISITFDEIISDNGVRLEVRESVSGVLVTGTSSVVGDTLTFIPDSDLLDDLMYDVMLLGSAEDFAGNIYTGQSTWSFTVAPLPDTTPPTLLALNPTDGAIDVNNTTVVSMTFDENISDNGVGLELRESVSAVLVTGTSSVVGDTLTFTPDNDLLDSTEYNVVLQGSVEDLSRNLYTGQSTWSFTVPDTAPPTIVSLTPIDGATDVNKSSVISMTFDENIVRVTMVVEVQESISGILVNGTLGIAGGTLSFTPDSDFLDGTEYTVTAQGSLEDVYSNVYTGVSIWSFTTATAIVVPPPVDAIAPTLVALIPTDSATDINKSILVSMAFDENISDNGVILEVRDTLTNTLVSGTNSVVGNSLTFTPDSDLADGEAYGVNIVGTIEDLSGNLYVGQNGWSFTVADTIAPLLTSLTPTDGAVDVDKTTEVVITLTENISDNGVILEVRDTLTNTLVSGTNSVVGNSLTFTPDSDLEDSEEYGVTVVGSLEDVSGNLYTGQSSWSFTVAPLADLIAPGLVAFTPADGSINIDKNTDINMTFDENITNGGKIFDIYDYTASAFVSGTEGITGNTLWFIPDSPLIEDHNYTVEISGPTRDLDGNVYTGQIVWSFQVAPLADVTEPTLVSLTPFDGELDVNISLNMTMTFDENISDNGVILELRDSNNTLVGGTSIVSTNTFNFDPSEDLKENETYTVTVSGTIEDSAGNVYTGPTIWSFTTEDNTAPVLILLKPREDTLNAKVGTNIKMQFDEDIADNGVVLEVRDSTNALVSGTHIVNGNVLKLIPDSNLMNAMEYNVTVQGIIVDLSGNIYTGQNSWSFTVVPLVDNIPPVLILFTPDDGETNADKSTEIKVEFDENVTNDGQKLTLYNDTLGSAVSGTGETGNTLWFTPDSNLIPDHNYTVTIDGTTSDLSGNIYAGQTEWRFHVKVFGLTNVSVFGDFVYFSFSYKLNELTISASDFEINSGSIGFGSFFYSNLFNTVTFIAETDLVDGDVIHVFGTIEDEDGNLIYNGNDIYITVVD